MSRKVFISFLGTNFYKECDYAYPDKSEKFCHTKFIQVATLDYLCSISKEEWDTDDVAYILLTDEARQNNWKDNHTFVTEITDSKGNAHKWEDKQQAGLERALSDFKEEFGYDFKIRPIDIPNDDENAKWQLFKIFSGKDENGIDYLQSGDELYIDVTHGFRYLPMFLLVFSNYVKFFRSIEVKHISYGNYEGRSGNVAPIVDLTKYSVLQDWTYATRSYLESGNSTQLVNLSKEQYPHFSDLLEKVVADFHTCRSVSIVEGTNLKELNNALDSVTPDDIPPLLNVLSLLKSQIRQYKKTTNVFDHNNVRNGYFSAIWCFNNQMYQQAITILQEALITDICQRNPSLDWKDNSHDGGRNKMVRRQFNNLYYSSHPEEDTNNTQRFSWYYSGIELLYPIWESTFKVRNDLDHAGFINIYDSSADVMSNVEKSFSMMIQILFNGQKRLTSRNGIPYIENIN